MHGFHAAGQRRGRVGVLIYGPVRLNGDLHIHVLANPHKTSHSMRLNYPKVTIACLSKCKGPRPDCNTDP